VKVQSNRVGIRRLVQVHMRLGATASNMHILKHVAEKIVNHSLLQQRQSQDEMRYRDRITHLKFDDALEWEQFLGFENLSLAQMDFFIIYCRNSPLEVIILHIQCILLAVIISSNSFVALHFHPICSNVIFLKNAFHFINDMLWFPRQKSMLP
jgi:hypothetical protein